MSVVVLGPELVKGSFELLVLHLSLASTLLSSD